MKIKHKLFSKKWDFICTDFGHCGNGEVKFNSTGWSSKFIAEQRGLQHQLEHEDGILMEPLEIFRKRYEVGN